MKARRPPAPSAIHSYGFTLVELLVSISVIAVLLAILLPALDSSRRAAARTHCLSRLGGLGVAAGSYANDHDGILPTMFRGPSPELQFINDWGWNDHAALPIDQIVLWCYLLGPYLDSENLLRQAEAVSCPNVFPEMSANVSSPDRVVVPAYAVVSYNYSVTCFTSPSAWTASAPGPDVNLAHQANQAAAVRHPSSKSVLVEFASRHDPTPRRLWEPGAGTVNVLAADAHAEPIDVERSNEPIHFSGQSIDTPNYFPWTAHPIPLFATPGGIHGTDWRR